MTLVIKELWRFTDNGQNFSMIHTNWHTRTHTHTFTNTHTYKHRKWSQDHTMHTCYVGKFFFCQDQLIKVHFSQVIVNFWMKKNFFYAPLIFSFHKNITSIIFKICQFFKHFKALSRPNKCVMFQHVKSRPCVWKVTTWKVKTKCLIQKVGLIWNCLLMHRPKRLREANLKIQAVKT